MHMKVFIFEVRCNSVLLILSVKVGAGRKNKRDFGAIAREVIA